jgi:hypothetical protein
MTHLLLLGLAGDVPTAACAADRMSVTQNHGSMKLIVFINAIADTYQKTGVKHTFLCPVAPGSTVEISPHRSVSPLPAAFD